MPTASYDSLEQVVNAARARLLDAMVTLGGEVLTDSAAQTIQVVNSAYRKMQDFLSKLGFQKFTGQIMFSGLAAVASTDPSIQVRIDWTGYSNHSSLQPLIALPADFITPMGMDERINGSVEAFLPMDDFSDQGLPLAPKQNWNKAWEWRGDAIYMPGSLQVMDVRLRYWSFAADFVANTTTPFANQPVPILRCMDCFSAYICAEAASARGDQAAVQFTADAEKAAMILAGREKPPAAEPESAENV